MPDSCAYCQRLAMLTREHVLPKFLYEGQGARHSGYNEAAGKVTSGEREIRDVCQICNNNTLKCLDDYGKNYYVTNRVDQTFTEDGEILVHYDYDLLLRWVLKVSYNSYRTVESHRGPFGSLVPYILNGSPRPRGRFVKLFLELIRDHRLSDIDRSVQISPFKESGFIPCRMLASGRAMLALGVDDYHCRHFQMNAHRFTLLLHSYKTRPRESERATRWFLGAYPASRLLDSSVNNIRLPVSQRDVRTVNFDELHPNERLAEADFMRKRFGR